MEYKTETLWELRDRMIKKNKDRNEHIVGLLNDIFPEKGITAIIVGYGIDYPNTDQLLSILTTYKPSLFT